MMISATKLHNTFPNGQFLIDSFNESIRLDRNKNGGGILLFIGEDIPTKFLCFETPPIERFFIETDLCKKKRLLCGYYNPDSKPPFRVKYDFRHVILTI